MLMVLGGSNNYEGPSFDVGERWEDSGWIGKGVELKVNYVWISRGSWYCFFVSHINELGCAWLRWWLERGYSRWCRDMDLE